MDSIEKPCTSSSGPSAGFEDNADRIIPPNQPVFLRVGGHEWDEVPSGEYVARCTKVDPEYRFMNNRKLALYFVVLEGKHSGKRARLFYNKRNIELAEQTGSDFGQGSKFFQDVNRLFPELIGDGSVPVEIDPNSLFFGKSFLIIVETSTNKKQAVVTGIEHYPGW